MQNVNYIKHLKGVFLQFSKDNRLNPTHISLYIALFQIWNNNRFLEEFYINREEVMRFSKIGSKSTYHKCIKDLSHWKYIMYYPSHNPYKGSKIKMFKFETLIETIKTLINLTSQKMKKKSLIFSKKKTGQKSKLKNFTIITKALVGK